MKTIIDNEGKKVQVEESLYNELQKSLKDGYWMVMIKVDGQPHMIPLSENFSY